MCSMAFSYARKRKSLACEVIPIRNDSPSPITVSQHEELLPIKVEEAFNGDQGHDNINPVFAVRYTPTQFLRANTLELGLRKSEIRRRGEEHVEDAATVVRMSPEEFLQKDPVVLGLNSLNGVDDLADLFPCREKKDDTPDPRIYENAGEEPVFVLTAEEFLETPPISLGLGPDSARYMFLPDDMIGVVHDPRFADEAASHSLQIAVVNHNSAANSTIPHANAAFMPPIIPPATAIEVLERSVATANLVVPRAPTKPRPPAVIAPTAAPVVLRADIEPQASLAALTSANPAPERTQTELRAPAETTEKKSAALPEADANILTFTPPAVGERSEDHSLQRSLTNESGLIELPISTMALEEFCHELDHALLADFNRERSINSPESWSREVKQASINNLKKLKSGDIGSSVSNSSSDSSLKYWDVPNDPKLKAKKSGFLVGMSKKVKKFGVEFRKMLSKGRS